MMHICRSLVLGWGSIFLKNNCQAYWYDAQKRLKKISLWDYFLFYMCGIHEYLPPFIYSSVRKVTLKYPTFFGCTIGLKFCMQRISNSLANCTAVSALVIKIWYSVSIGNILSKNVFDQKELVEACQRMSSEIFQQNQLCRNFTVWFDC